MNLKVTAEDIRLGKKRSPRSCPVARALRRRYPGREVSVHNYGCEVFKDRKSFQRIAEFIVSDDTTTRINNFDDGKGMKPFTAVLRKV